MDPRTSPGFCRGESCLCDIFRKFEKLTENGTETMGLETGGRSAAPTKKNKRRSPLAIHDERIRRTEIEIEENAAAEKHEREQNYLQTMLSKTHSNIKKDEKKPMMLHEDNRNMSNFLEKCEAIQIQIRDMMERSTEKKKHDDENNNYTCQ